MKKILLYTSYISTLSMLFAFSPRAQILGGEEAASDSYSAGSFSVESVEKPSAPNNSKPVQCGVKKQTETQNDSDTDETDNLTTESKPGAAAPQTAPAVQNKRKVPPQYRILKITEKGYKLDDSEAIYLYYNDFKINHMAGGAISCDVRFVLRTALADKLSNISMRLVWPDMETSLTFDDVDPGVPTYYDYRLYGEGCYSMDKLPNVVINRCRLKDHSQKECAALLQIMQYRKM